MKKVLTVFLSIVLILAMMPSMAFATDGSGATENSNTLYCFYVDGLTVGDDGYLVSSNDSEPVVLNPITAPSVVVGQEGTFYFAIRDGEKYKVVSSVNCNSENVTCTANEDNSYKVNISEPGSYELSYAVTGGVLHTT